MCGVRGERDRRRGRREKHLLWSCLSALRSLIASCSRRAVPAAPQAEAGSSTCCPEGRPTGQDPAEKFPDSLFCPENPELGLSHFL